jgi:hypothetical protein
MTSNKIILKQEKKTLTQEVFGRREIRRSGEKKKRKPNNAERTHVL